MFQTTNQYIYIILHHILLNQVVVAQHSNGGGLFTFKLCNIFIAHQNYTTFLYLVKFDYIVLLDLCTVNVTWSLKSNSSINHYIRLESVSISIVFFWIKLTLHAFYNNCSFSFHLTGLLHHPSYRGQCSSNFPLSLAIIYLPSLVFNVQ